jgi:hypothetical protein
MNNKGKEVTTKLPDKKVKTWSQRTKVGDNSKSVDVEELDNGGFLITLSTDTKNPKTGSWDYKTNKYFSKTNPLDEDPNKDETLESIMKELNV